MMKYDDVQFGTNYSYVVGRNDDVIKDLGKDPISIYVRANKSHVKKNHVGFAAVVTVRNQQDAFYIVGSTKTTEKTKYASVRRRCNLRSLLKAGELIVKHCDSCTINLYVSDPYVIRFLKRDWGILWKEHHFKKANGDTPKNMDLIKPLTQLLYTDDFKKCIINIYNTEDLGHNEEYAEKRAIRIANEKSKYYTSESVA